MGRSLFHYGIAFADAIAGVKTCCSCRVTQELSAFYKGDGRMGRGSRCKACGIPPPGFRALKNRADELSRGERKCPRCNVVKSLALFCKKTSYCVTCRREMRKPLTLEQKTVELERARARYWSDPTNRRVRKETALKSMYGIDFHDLALLYERQNGVCGGCLSPITWGKTTHVDHDHVTGVVRGILCQPCNLVIGQVSESPDTLVSLAQYLRANK